MYVDDPILQVYLYIYVVSITTLSSDVQCETQLKT